MKNLSLVILFLLISFVAFGQTPDPDLYCHVTGIVERRLGGDIAPGVRFDVFRVVKSGILIAKGANPSTAVTGTDGSISLYIRRASTACIYADVEGWNRNKQTGTCVAIPDAETAELTDLTPVISVATTINFPTQSGNSGKCLSTDGTTMEWITCAAGSGSGTVTSFSAGDLSPLFTTSEATVTTTPALTFSLTNQSANRVFAGPTTGSAAAPTFRSLVAADIPDLLAVYAATSHAHAATEITSGTLPDARFPATLPIASGVNLTALNASNLASGTVPLGRLSGITNTEVSGSAAIAYSKLNLTGSVVDADINTSAAIALSKLAALTASRALVSSAGGVVAVSSVTATEIGRLSGVTSSVQTQIDAKGDALTTNPLSQFAATASAQLAGVLSDETGSGGGFVRATAPTIAGGTHTAITSFGLRSTGTGAFDLTIDNSENLTAGRTLTIAMGDATRTLTLGGNATLNGGTHSGTNTGDQTSVSGNAGTATALATPRTIGGNSFDGSANITVGSATAGFAVSGGDLALGANNLTITGSIGATGARATKLWAVDGEFTNMITVGGTSLSSTFQGLDTQLTDVAALAYSGNALKVVRVNAGETGFELATAAGGDTPGGSGSEIQYRGGASTLSAVTSSSVSGGQITLADFATVAVDSATTNAAVKVIDLQVSSSGTPAANLGSAIRVGLETTTTANQDASQISTIWTTATHASRTGAIVFSLVNGAAALAEKYRFNGDGFLEFQHVKGIKVGAGANLQVIGPNYLQLGGANIAFYDAAIGTIYFQKNNRNTLEILNATVTETGYPLLSVTGTWNASGVTHDGIKVNVTNTASAAGSRLLNLQVGSTAKVVVTKEAELQIFNGTAPTASITDGVQFYSEDVSSSAEAKVRDEAGNITTLSPHNFSMFQPDPIDPAIPFSYYSKNVYIGKEMSVDWIGVIRELERTSGKQFIIINNLPANQTRNWDDDEEAKRLERQAQRDDWQARKSQRDKEQADFDKLTAQEKEGKQRPADFTEAQPAPYTKRPEPKYISDRKPK